ncbi:hypothetical protein [Streptomyces sp. NPDC002324]
MNAMVQLPGAEPPAQRQAALVDLLDLVRVSLRILIVSVGVQEPVTVGIGTLRGLATTGEATDGHPDRPNGLTEVTDASARRIGTDPDTVERDLGRSQIDRHPVSPPHGALDI